MSQLSPKHSCHKPSIYRKWTCDSPGELGRSHQTPHNATRPQADKAQSSPIAPSPSWFMRDWEPQWLHPFPWHW